MCDVVQGSSSFDDEPDLNNTLYPSLHAEREKTRFIPLRSVALPSMVLGRSATAFLSPLSAAQFPWSWMDRLVASPFDGLSECFRQLEPRVATSCAT